MLLILALPFYQRFVLVDAWSGSRRITATWDGMAWSDDIFFSFPSIPLQTQYADTRFPKFRPHKIRESTITHPKKHPHSLTYRIFCLFVFLPLLPFSMSEPCTWFEALV